MHTSQAATYYIAQLNLIQVLEFKNGGFLITRYPLVEENPDHPRLRLLRKREKLDDVFAPGETEFEKIVLLRKLL